MLSRLQGDHFLKSNRGKRITKLVFGNQFWRLPRNNRVVKHIFLRLFVLFWDLSCENEMPNSMTNTDICIYHEPRPGHKCQDQNWFPDRFRECCMRDCSKQWRYQILTASSSRCFRTAPNVEPVICSQILSARFAGCTGHNTMDQFWIRQRWIFLFV